MKPKKNEDKRSQIIISFPDHVNLPLGIEGAFQSLVRMICEQYEKENEGIVMWPAGIGSRLKSGMANDNLVFDDSTLVIECSMREMTERDKYNKGLPSTFVPEPRKDRTSCAQGSAPDIKEAQFTDNQQPQGGRITAPNAAQFNR